MGPIYGHSITMIRGRCKIGKISPMSIEYVTFYIFARFVFAWLL